MPKASESRVRRLPLSISHHNENIMSEKSKGEHHWIIKVLVICVSAITAAYGSGGLSFLILLFLFRGGDCAYWGIYGFPIGFLIAGGMATWFLSKGVSIGKVFAVSTLLAFLASCLFAVTAYVFDFCNKF